MDRSRSTNHALSARQRATRLLAGGALIASPAKAQTQASVKPAAYRQKIGMTIKFDYIGKVAFVMGSGTGIGHTAAPAFAKTGASVAVVGLAEEKTLEMAGPA